MTQNRNMFLRPLEDMFSAAGLKSLKQSFVKGFLDENGIKPVNVLIFDDEIWENDEVYYFSDYFSDEFEKRLSQAKNELEDLLSSRSTNKNRIAKYIQTTLKFVLDKSQDLKLTQQVKQELTIFKTYLNSKHNIQITLGKEKFKDDGDFGYLGKEKDLKKLYALSTRQSLIFSVDEVSESGFIDFFTTKNPSNKLKFSCSTDIAVGYLLSISPLFKRFKKSDILKNNNIFTNTAKLLTGENFDTSKFRFSKNENSQIVLNEIIQYIDIVRIK